MRRKKTAILMAALASAALLFLGALFLLESPQRLPNVILISIDTLRPDRMGVYGHRPLGRSTTPFLDSLAAKGAVFEKALSTTSWTLPAHYAMLSGMPNQVHGITDDRILPPSNIPMMAELLKAAGYATGGFYSGPYLHPVFGFGRGFDVYESCMGFESLYDVPEDKLATLSPVERERLAGKKEFEAHRAVTSRRVTDEGLRFVGGHAGGPFFLFLHYFDAHNDYLPPPPFDTRFDRPYRGWVTGEGVTTDPRYNPQMAPRDLEHLEALYDGEIGWVDENIARLFEGIGKIDPDILKKTLVVVTSDHGEEFFEHGRLTHRHDLYGCEVRIPLILSCPGRIHAGVRSKAPARIYDILPTVADFVKVRPPPAVVGRSLLPALEGSLSGSEPALLELTEFSRTERSSFKKHVALVEGGLKLIVVQKRRWSAKHPLDYGGAVIAQRMELYDLEKDPGEKENLALRRKDLVSRMLAAMKVCSEKMLAARAKLPPPERRGSGRVPERIRKQLEQLGYGGGGK